MIYNIPITFLAAKITKGIEFKPRAINFELLNKNLKGIVVRDFEYFMHSNLILTDVLLE